MADKFKGETDAAARATKPEPRTTIDQLIKESGVFTNTATKARQVARDEGKTEEEILAAGRQAVVKQILSIIGDKKDGHPAKQAARAAFAEAGASAGKTGYDQQAAAAIAGLKVLRMTAAADLAAKAAPKPATAPKAAPKTAAHSSSDASSDKGAKTTKRSFFRRVMDFVFSTDPPAAAKPYLNTLDDIVDTSRTLQNIYYDKAREKEGTVGMEAGHKAVVNELFKILNKSPDSPAMQAAQAALNSSGGTKEEKRKAAAIAGANVLFGREPAPSQMPAPASMSATENPTSTSTSTPTPPSSGNPFAGAEFDPPAPAAQTPAAQTPAAQTPAPTPPAAAQKTPPAKTKLPHLGTLDDIVDTSRNLQNIYYAKAREKEGTVGMEAGHKAVVNELFKILNKSPDSPAMQAAQAALNSSGGTQEEKRKAAAIAGANVLLDREPAAPQQSVPVSPISSPATMSGNAELNAVDEHNEAQKNSQTPDPNSVTHDHDNENNVNPMHR